MAVGLRSVHLTARCISSPPPNTRRSPNGSPGPSLHAFASSPLLRNVAWTCLPSTNRTMPGKQTLVRMGLRAVESFDGSFQLKPECELQLKTMLGSETFCQQVSEQPGVVQGYKYEFTGELFQPVPWSLQTKHGMPQEFEKYFHDKDNFAIVNVPPNFMFKAKIFHPSRLCAVFRKIGKIEAE